MPITKIELRDFCAFEYLALEFSPGLNVFIGENGTGKTHLMKLLYALTKSVSVEESKGGTNDASERARVRLEDKLNGVFKPDGDRLGRLVYRRVGRHKAIVRVWCGAEAGRLSFTVSTQDRMVVRHLPQKPLPRSIFIPSREAMTIFPGFIPFYENRELSIDETYYDLCKALSATPLKGPRAREVRTIISPLEGILGGRVVLEGGRFYLHSTSGAGNLEAPLLAEGFRKIGSLVHLIANGSLMRNAILFWDEPEANLNPKLVTRIAAALRSLASMGIQVFIATHDFLLSNEVALAVEYKKEPAVATRFYCFSRQKPSGSLKVELAEHLADLKDNPILQEFAAHYDREQCLFYGSGEGGQHGEVL